MAVMEPGGSKVITVLAKRHMETSCWWPVACDHHMQGSTMVQGPPPAGATSKASLGKPGLAGAPRLETQPGLGLGCHLGPRLEPQLGLGLGCHLGPRLEPQPGLGLGCHLGPRLEPQLA